MLGAGAPQRALQRCQHGARHLLNRLPIGGQGRREVAALQQAQGSTIRLKPLPGRVPDLMITALAGGNVIVLLAPDRAFFALAAAWLRHTTPLPHAVLWGTSAIIAE
jgi:hypothetical protein